MKKAVLENFEYSQQNICAGLQLYSFWYKCFPVDFAKFLTLFFTEHLWATASEEVKTSKVPLIRRNY